MLLEESLQMQVEMRTLKIRARHAEVCLPWGATRGRWVAGLMPRPCCKLPLWLPCIGDS